VSPVYCKKIRLYSNKTDGGDTFWSLPFRQPPAHRSVPWQYWRHGGRHAAAVDDRCADLEMLCPHHSADSDHRSANWGRSELGEQSARKNQLACLLNSGWDDVTQSTSFSLYMCHVIGFFNYFLLFIHGWGGVVTLVRLPETYESVTWQWVMPVVCGLFVFSVCVREWDCSLWSGRTTWIMYVERKLVLFVRL